MIQVFLGTNGTALLLIDVSNDLAFESSEPLVEQMATVLKAV